MSHDTLPGSLIDRYLRNQLTGPELEDFEIRMLEQPDLFRAVQQTEQMKEALRTAKLAPGKAQSSELIRLPARLWIRQPLSMAATVLLCASILLSSSYLLRGGPEKIPGDALAINSVITLVPTRSAQSVLTYAAGLHLLQVDVGISLNGDTYRLTLASDSGSEQYELQVTADNNGFVRMLTPRSLTGPYTLTVQRSDSADVAGSYRLHFN
jgi:hypothetical protein